MSPQTPTTPAADHPRPPLGVFPRFLWQEEFAQNLETATADELVARRVTALTNAMGRYLCAALAIPLVWVEEYNDLLTLNPTPGHGQV